MFKKNLVKSILMGALASIAFTSCQKEDVLVPQEQSTDTTNTLIYVRAVDKDSSAVESQQLLLR